MAEVTFRVEERPWGYGDTVYSQGEHSVDADDAFASAIAAAASARVGVTIVEDSDGACDGHVEPDEVSKRYQDARYEAVVKRDSALLPHDRELDTETKKAQHRRNQAVEAGELSEAEADAALEAVTSQAQAAYAEAAEPIRAEFDSDLDAIDEARLSGAYE